MTLPVIVLTALSFLSSPAGAVVQESILGRPCGNSDECQAVPAADCIVNSCTCIEGYEPNFDTDTCLGDGTLGFPCLTDPQCFDELAICTTEECICPQPDFINYQYKCYFDCGPLEDPINGHVNVTGNRELSRLEAFFTCDPGYVLNGPGQLICEIEAQWDGPVPTCEETNTASSTSPLPPPECPNACLNGGTCDTVIEGQVLCNCPEGFSGALCDLEDFCVTQPCPQGYECIGPGADGNRECGCPVGTQGPGCSYSCGPLNVPPNGQVVITENTELSQLEAIFTCPPGYVLNGPNQLICTINGLWEVDSPTCDEIPPTPSPSSTASNTPPPECPEICLNGGTCESVLNGQVFCACPEGFSGAICDDENYCVTQPCPPGYECIFIGTGRTEGNRDCVCPEGTQGPNCSYSCGPLEFSPNGQVHITENEQLGHLEASFTCAPGYTLNGPNMLICMTNGLWEGDPPTCDQIPTDGTLGNPCLINANTECFDPFAICSEGSICECQPDYMNYFGDCYLDCGPLEHPVNGHLIITGYKQLSRLEATFMCDPEFVLNGPGQLICEGEAQWNGPVPTCDETPTGDGNLGHPCSIDNVCFDPLAVCSAETICECNLGYGNYGGTCYVECEPLPAPINGNVRITGNTELGQLEAVYSCERGFFLQGPPQLFCETGGTWNTDPPICTISSSSVSPHFNSSTPTTPGCPLNCLNGGTCSDEGNLFCECLDGFSGDLCEFEDFCVTQPCPPEVECILLEEEPGVTHYCVCPEGTRGPHCTLFDEPIVCRNTSRRVYFDGDNETMSNNGRRTCFNRKNETEQRRCYDPDGPLDFEIVSNADIVELVEPSEGDFCILLNITNTTVESNCVELIAYQSEDFGFRPWVNETVSVCYVHNRPPKFVNPNQGGAVPINVFNMVEPELFTLSATDPDLHQVPVISLKGVYPEDFTPGFTLDGSVLIVDRPDEGLLLDLPVDVKVHLQVEDNGIPSLTNQVTVTVRFVNQSLLCFPSRNTYYVHTVPIPEAQVNVGQVICTGQPLNTLTFELDPNTDTGPAAIGTAGEIDYDPLAAENTGIFEYVVVVTVAEPVIATSSVTFTVIAEDLSPSCEQLQSEVTFNEIDLSDTCSDAVYECSSPDPSSIIQCPMTPAEFVFRCNNSFVSVCIQAWIRNTVGTFPISENVTNEYGFVTVEATVIVENFNDPPRFIVNVTQLENITVPETLPVGDTFISIAVFDADTKHSPPLDDLTIYLTESSTESWMFGATLNTAQDRVNISLLDPFIIKLQRSFSLTLTLTDNSGLSDSVLIRINVKDINEPPTCAPVSDTEVSIRSPVGSEVAFLECSDPDIDVPLRTLTYSIQTSEYAGYFKMNRNGVIIINSSLVNLSTPNLSILLQVNVTDGRGLGTMAPVRLLINNDFPPACSQIKPAFTIDEDADIQTCKPVAHDCIDPVKEGTLTFTVFAGNGTNQFRVGPTSDPFEIEVCTKESLRGNIGLWVLRVNVTSPYGATPISISVTVDDVNDPPEFLKPTYTDSVRESLAVGASVLTVTAIDQDTGVLAELTYYIEGPEGKGAAEFFAINEDTGVVTVNAPLDAETSPTFEFIVGARDGGPVALTATASVTINIDDTNDEPPICAVDAIEVSIDVIATVNTLVTTLDCSDADITPSFSQQDYSISNSEVFAVNDIGEVTLASELNATTTEYDLTVTVQDADREDLSTTVEIFVSVNTDFGPSCIQIQQEVIFQETDIGGTCSDAIFQCESPLPIDCSDTSEYFDITCGNTVIVVCVQGQIRHNSGTFIVTGEATNPYGDDAIEFSVTVENVDDPPAILVDASLLDNVEVPETAAVDDTVTVIDVIDADVNLSVPLDTLTVELFDSSTESVTSVFGARLNEAQDIVTVYVMQTLYIEIKRNYELFLQVTDSTGLSDSVPITINVQDINEPPSCATVSETEVSITSPLGSEVVFLECSDPDIDEPFRTLTFSIQTSEYSGYFTVNDNGVITVSSALTDLVGPGLKAKLTVDVLDGGGLSTSSFVDIIFNNFYPPICGQEDLVLSIDENTSECSPVSHDCLEPVQEGLLMFSTIDGTNLFGLGTSNDPAELSVCAEDSLKGQIGTWPLTINVTSPYGATTVSISVTVTDVNDPPMFVNPAYSETVSEGLTVGAPVLTVTAVDPDTGLLGVLTYYSEGPGGIADSEFFALDGNTGVITVKAPLDAETSTTFQYTVLVGDGPPEPLTATASVIINVDDTNDEPPTCDEVVIEVSIDVIATVDSLVTTLDCSDADITPAFSQQVYSISNSDVFAINSTGHVTLLSQPDVTTTEYDLTVTVQDTDREDLSTTVEIFVSVNTDFGPICTPGAQSEVVFQETDAVDSCSDVIFECPSASILECSDTSTAFYLDCSSNAITVCVQESIQGNVGTFVIDGEVSNLYGADTVKFTVNVENVNDPPMILDDDALLKNVEVPETAAVGDTVAVIDVIDADLNLQIPLEELVVQLTDASTEEVPSVFGATLNDAQDRVNLLLLQPLDIDLQQTYGLTLTVTDSGGLSASVPITINVRDINEPPTCGPVSDTEVSIRSSVGSEIAFLECSDPDIDVPLRTLTYSIQSFEYSDLFAVDNTGVISVNGVLTDLTEPGLTFTVTVDVTDGGGLDTSVTMTFIIINSFPPVCSQTDLSLDFSENADESTCKMLAQDCIDQVEEGSLTFDIFAGNGNTLFRLGTSTDPAELSVCTDTLIKGEVGLWLLRVNVSSPFGETTVSISVTVNDVNDPPVFVNTPYTETVSEGLKVGDPVLSLTAVDPDTGVLGELTYYSEGEEGINESPYFSLSDTGIVSVESPLDAETATSFQFTVVVSDGAPEPLTAFTSVVIGVDDINDEPPTCAEDVIEVTIDVIATVGSLVTPLDCSDADITPAFSQQVYSISNSDVIEVNSTGHVIVGGPLDLSTNQYDLTVTVQDADRPDLSTNVQILVDVNNKIPPICSTDMTSPDIWVVDACATITMDCSDPTSETNELTYTTSGDFSQGFALDDDIPGIFILCYTQTSSGEYEIVVQVDNGLDVYELRETIVVEYPEATPVFTENIYAVNVSENVVPGTNVVTVDAVSQNQIGELVYLVIDTGSTSGWSDYLTLNEVNGQINTVKSIRPLAEDLIVLILEAKDTLAQLSSSAQVEITVIDINEVPQCTILSTNLELTIDAPVGTIIASFNCIDSDVKPAHRTLTYIIQMLDDIDSRFSLTDSDGIYSIETNTLLDVNTPTYPVQLSVSDAAATPLSFSQTFNVEVNLRPPAVVMVASAIRYDEIQVTWSYQRPDFYDVTTSFIVIVQNPSGTNVSSPELRADITAWNATGLNPTTKYRVFVQAVTQHGTTETPDDTVIATPEVPIIKLFTAIIRLPNIDYTPELRDAQSQIFFDVRQDLLDNLKQVLENTAGYVGWILLGFRKANSIFVDLQVAVNQSGTVQNTINTLNDSVTSGTINTLPVDPNYFVVSTEGIIEITAIGKSPDVVYSGTLCTITCDALTAGFLANQSFIFQWALDGNLIQPLASSRYSITSSTDPDIQEVKYTTLTINPILDRHAGDYTCIVSVPEGTSASETTTVEVISPPVVRVSPMSATVLSGDPISIRCEHVPADFQPLDGFNWYIDNVPQQEDGGNEILEGVAWEILILPAILETTVFGCEGYNEAGTGRRVSSHIGVSVPGIPDCPSEIDIYGTIWTESVPDATTVLNCEAGQTGEILRYCDVNGKWEPPIYDCVTEALTDIMEELDDIKDGTSNATINNVLEQLVNATTEKGLFTGDVKSTLESLDLISEIVNGTMEEDQLPTDVVEETDNYLQVASNLIDERNKPTWFALIANERGGAIDVPGSFETYIDRRINRLADNATAETTRTFVLENIYAEVGKGGSNQSYEFPDTSKSQAPTWIKDSSTKIYAPPNAFKQLETVYFGASFYRNITPILEKRLVKDGNVQDVTKEYEINSDIVSLQVKGLSSILDTPIVITFKHFNKTFGNPLCCSWDFKNDAFTTDGCFLLSTSEEFSECSCNHLTNFAILMSPSQTPASDIMALSIISSVGCAISIVCLLLTIVLHLSVWRFVKSDRAVLLLNLCVALVISYVIFLAGVGRAEIKIVCTAVSLLLHYIYLVVFFLMLAYGIEIFVSVKFVFASRSRIRWLLPLSWAVPVVIVAISAGVTKLEGYGNENFCWLSVDSGLLYAFIGPALLCILINFFIVIIVFRTMFKSSAMLTKTEREKVKTAARSICVLLPILGLTWLFGIFSVNEGLVAFQYIFAILNSLQGLFIFLFHAVLNTQIRDGLKQKSARKRSMATFNSDHKHQRSRMESTVVTGEIINNELSPSDKENQAHNRALAQRRKGVNLYDSQDDKEVEKDTPRELEGGKISNIIRENEATNGHPRTGQTRPLLNPPLQPTGDSDIRSSRDDSEANKSRWDYLREKRHEFKQKKSSIASRERSLERSLDHSAQNSSYSPYGQGMNPFGRTGHRTPSDLQHQHWDNNNGRPLHDPYQPFIRDTS